MPLQFLGLTFQASLYDASLELGEANFGGPHFQPIEVKEVLADRGDKLLVVGLEGEGEEEDFLSVEQQELPVYFDVVVFGVGVYVLIDVALLHKVLVLGQQQLPPRY